MNINELANELLNAGNNSPENGFDITARVVRIEDGMAYVHIDGGALETPALMTISAKVNDVVKVRIANGRAWITGNVTAPPTDDTAAEIVAQSVRATNARIDNLFAQDIEATGTIRGLKLKGSTITGSKFVNEGSGEYGPWSLDINEGYIRFYDKTTGETLGVIGPDAGVHVGFESDTGATIGPWDMAEFRRRNSEGGFDQAAIGLQMFRVIRKDGLYPVYIENTNGNAIYATFDVSGNSGVLDLQNCLISTDKSIEMTDASSNYYGRITFNPSGRFQIAIYKKSDNTLASYYVLDPNGYELVAGVKQQYAVGDTMTIGQQVCPAVRTAASSLYVTVKLDKPVTSAVKGVTLQNAKINEYNNGAIRLNNVTPTYTTVYNYLSSGYVTFIFTNAVTGAQSNSPSTVYFAAGSQIKFT